MERCTPSVQQEGQLVGEGYGLFTGVMRCFLLLETLCQMGLAFGTVNLGRRIIFLANGRLGFALQWMQQRTEVSKLVAIITPPQRPVTRGVRAGHEA